MLRPYITPSHQPFVYGFHQYVALIMKMFSAGAVSMLRIEEPNLKSPLSSKAERLCVQTKYSVEPGMYSQRSTALPRSDLKLKLWLPNDIGCAGPGPSGSTVYEFVESTYAIVEPLSRPSRVHDALSGLAI